MHCPYCGFKVQDDFLYCPKCGKSLGKTNPPSEIQNSSTSNNGSANEPFYKQTWFIFLMIFICFPIGLILAILFKGKAVKLCASLFLALILVVWFSIFWGEHKDAKSFTEIYSTVSSQSKPSQKEFNNIQKRYESEIRKTKTDLEKAEMNRKYEVEFNNFLKDRRVEKWFARVDRIDSENNGKAAYVSLICDFPNARYRTETKRFGLHDTLVPSNSELYKKIVSLKSGDYVLFSGNLVKSDYGNSNKIIDLSITYGDKNEKLLIKFSDITLVKAKE